MYGLDPDDMLANCTLDGVPDTPLRVAAASGTFVQNDGTVRMENAEASTTYLRNTGQKPFTVEWIPPVTQAANTVTEDSKVSDTRQSLFESRIVDGEADLLACTTEGWDLVRDLSSGKFLIRRRIRLKN